jgi:hypothetical protein
MGKMAQWGSWQVLCHTVFLRRHTQSVAGPTCLCMLAVGVMCGNLHLTPALLLYCNCCRVLPQVVLTVLVVLSSQSFSNVYYYSLAVAGMCLCHVLNVLKAMSIYSSKPERVAAAVAAAGPFMPAVTAGDAGASSSKSPAAAERPTCRS